MNMQELIKHMAAGQFKVRSKIPILHATSDIGTVQEVKILNEKNKGCGVNFPGTKWNTWFHDSDDTDKRTKYMRDLEITMPDLPKEIFDIEHGTPLYRFLAHGGFSLISTGDHHVFILEGIGYRFKVPADAMDPMGLDNADPNDVTFFMELAPNSDLKELFKNPRVQGIVYKEIPYCTLMRHGMTYLEKGRKLNDDRYTVENYLRYIRDRHWKTMEKLDEE